MENLFLHCFFYMFSVIVIDFGNNHVFKVLDYKHYFYLNLGIRVSTHDSYSFNTFRKKNYEAFKVRRFKAFFILNVR